MHWTVHIDGGPKRVNLASILGQNQLIYSFGGYCTEENYAIQRKSQIFRNFCPNSYDTDIWEMFHAFFFRWKVINYEADPSIPFQRYGHTTVCFGRYVYLWGGRNDESACKTLYRFDTKTNIWDKPQVSGVVPGARDGHSAVVIRNKMFIFGGYEEEIGLFSQDVYALDLNTLTWSFVPTAGQAPSFRDFHTATVYLDRYMFVFGGRGDLHGPFHTRSEMYCNTLVCLDVERQEWFRPQTKGEVPLGRRSHSAFMHSGYMYIFGGYNGVSDQHYDDFFRYDPESGEWKEVVPFGEGPAPRRRQGCVVLENRVFFFGGTSPSLLENVSPEPDNDFSEESNLIDHDDMFVLDMEPTLKTLCILRVLESGVDRSCLPKDLMQEIAWMKTPNRISPLSSG